MTLHLALNLLQQSAAVVALTPLLSGNRRRLALQGIMKLSCPTCSAISEVEDQFAGQIADCPACNQSLVIPTPPAEPPILRAAPRNQSKNRSSAIGIVRWIRAFVGFFFWLQILGMLPVLTWIFSPTDISGEMIGMLFMKIATASIFWAVFYGLRILINDLHYRRYGSPHPILSRKKWAL